MSRDEDWDEPRLFLAEQTRTIRREFATLAIPVLLAAAAIGFVGLAKERPQLAAQTAHAPPAIVDQH
jgi:hypothetical protein